MGDPRAATKQRAFICSEEDRSHERQEVKARTERKEAIIQEWRKPLVSGCLGGLGGESDIHFGTIIS
jgi:hypothetical protein